MRLIHFCFLAGLLSLPNWAAQETLEKAGRTTPGRTVTPVNQIVTPTGYQIELPGLRPQAIALSPNGLLLATAGKTSELIIIDPATAQIRQRVALPSSAQNEPAPRAVSP